MSNKSFVLGEHVLIDGIENIITAIGLEDGDNIYECTNVYGEVNYLHAFEGIEPISNS